MFDTHILNENGIKEVKTYKEQMNRWAHSVLSLLPEGREKSIFKTKMEEAAFFGTRAIASKEGNYSEVHKYDEGL
jgi:hypothetical protein